MNRPRANENGAASGDVVVVTEESFSSLRNRTVNACVGHSPQGLVTPARV